MSKNIQNIVDLKELVSELSQTNSSNDKVNIIKKYPACKELLECVYNPFKQYGITSKNLKKMEGKLTANKLISDNNYSNITELLDALCKREITGHQAIFNANEFIKKNIEFKDLIYNIFDKNLKVRIDASLVNKAFPKLVPQFKVALAKPYDDHRKKVNFVKNDWYVSRKLDGVRVLCVIQGDSIKFFSRAGKEFTTCQKVAEALSYYKLKSGVVLDGEMCVINENGDEDFTAAVSQIKRKDIAMKNPVFKVFDMISLEDFNNHKSKENLVARRERLDLFLHHLYLANSGAEKIINKLDHEKVTDENFLIEKVEEASKAGWEGLMIRKNTIYEGKRTDSLLKLKKFFDDEYEVLGIENGKMRVIDSETGLEKEVDTLAAVVIEHKGHRVGVGSGFSIAQREQFFHDPSKIIGKIITVQYFEESKNKDGGISLRFPTVKKIWEGERDI